MKKLIFSAVLVLSLGLVGCGEDVTKEDKTKEEIQTPVSSDKTDEENAETNEDIYFKNNEAKLNDFRINITETKVIQVGDKGNEYGEKPIFAIWYKTTNLSDTDINPASAWLDVFTAIQDNNPNAVNEISIGMLPDDRFLDTQLETIKKDGTVENAVAYELDDLETPVTLVANQYFDKEFGRQDYKIKQ
ncbi:DUF5067 domain-containing protein [Lysinibacillus sphaericus]|uniref:DUF5067 domain-containing protein n=1 Tax=Lysinibacillus sphaericus TaxID=1421 RepID=UPI003D0620B6